MIKCPSCKYEINEDNFIRKRFSDKIGKEYKLYHCPNCDLQFWTPLEFVKEVYTEDILNIGYSVFHEVPSDIEANHRLFINKLSRYILQTFNSPKILDVGCGNGSFLHYLSKIGFETYGTDLDKNSINVARNFFGVKNVFELSLEDFVNYSKQNNLEFDVITFFEVLEHQVAPYEFVKNVKEILSKNGIVAGSVPNRNRFLANITRLIGEGDFPPHHFLWFSRKSIENLFRENGFEVILIENLRGDILALLSKISFLIRSLFHQLKSNNPKLSFLEKLKGALWFFLKNLLLHIYVFVFGFGMFFAFKKKDN